MANSKETIEFGDFQTPLSLANDVMLTTDSLSKYSKIIEPTCGVGSFLHACLNLRVDSSKLEGWEINPEYVRLANESIKHDKNTHIEIVKEQDFFKVNWFNLKKRYVAPILFVGNPPWVTNSELGKLLSKNLPEKYNFQNLSGLEAMTGKSNFDISEWMLIQLLEFISSSSSSISFLIKTSVARKLFQYISKNKLFISRISIKEIDAKKHFDVSVDACLFQAHGNEEQTAKYECQIFKNLSDEKPVSTMGVVDGKLVSDITSYKFLSHIDQGSEFKWRSGVKHDASKVMEFDLVDEVLINGLSELSDIPFDYLYPMYKSSHIAKTNIGLPTKYMLITQQKIGDNTKNIEKISPKTWIYLENHSTKLDARKSSIYKKSPRFSIFGVGEYTFLPWKIVISGLYKNIIFSKIGFYKEKPIIVDDTCYMLGFDSEEKADFILHLLNSKICKDFIASIIFLDNKRPITVALLNRINTKEIAKELGLFDNYQDIFETENYQLALL